MQIEFWRNNIENIIGNMYVQYFVKENIIESYRKPYFLTLYHYNTSL
jgi:hypothetical protein